MQYLPRRIAVAISGVLALASCTQAVGTEEHQEGHRSISAEEVGLSGQALSVIFFDDMEDSERFDSNWTYTIEFDDCYQSRYADRNGTYGLRTRDNGACISRDGAIDATGYKDLVMSYWRRASSFGAYEYYNVYFDCGDGWELIEAGDSEWWAHKTHQLPAKCDNHPNVRLIFDVDLGTNTDYFNVDDVLVEGTPTGECTRAETCGNGLDDDCDGVVDGGFQCMDVQFAPTIDEVITECPSAAVLDAIDADLDIRFEYEGDLTGEGFVCTAAEGSRDLTHFQERVYQALISLRAVQFDGPVEWTSMPLYDWLVHTIDGIRLRDDINNSFCCTAPADGEGAYYINLLATPNSSALFTDLWTTSGGSGLNALTQLMVHETRHADGPQDELGTVPRPHTCGSSDEAIDELGAWGTVYYYFRNLAFNSDECFLRPVLPDSSEYPGQLFGADDYLEAARDRSYSVQSNRFCSEPSSPPETPETVPAC